LGAQVAGEGERTRQRHVHSFRSARAEWYPLLRAVKDRDISDSTVVV
jgi:hypothetical protein